MIPFEVEDLTADADDDEAVDDAVVEEVVVTGYDSKEASDEDELLDDLAMEVETLMLTFGGSFLLFLLLLFCNSCFWRCSFGENGPNGILTNGVVVVARFKLVLLEVLLKVGLKSDKLVGLVSVEVSLVVVLVVVLLVVVVVVVVVLVS